MIGKMCESLIGKENNPVNEMFSGLLKEEWDKDLSDDVKNRVRQLLSSYNVDLQKAKFEKYNFSGASDPILKDTKGKIVFYLMKTKIYNRDNFSYQDGKDLWVVYTKDNNEYTPDGSLSLQNYLGKRLRNQGYRLVGKSGTEYEINYDKSIKTNLRSREKFADCVHLVYTVDLEDKSNLNTTVKDVRRESKKGSVDRKKVDIYTSGDYWDKSGYPKAQDKYKKMLADIHASQGGRRCCNGCNKDFR